MSDAEEKDGWQLLFNGENLEGWHGYLQEKPSDNWQVDQGAILVNAGDKNGEVDLVTDQEFANFDLKLEWKMDSCSNSGVMFHVKEAPQYKNTYETGPEMQITDLACYYISTGDKYSDSRIYLHRAGDLYGVVPADTEWVKPAPSWNEYEIIAFNGRLQFFQNGHKIVDTRMWDNNWNRRIQRSKFADWPGFGTFRKGHVSLQGTEDGRLWFRNIKIRELRFGPSS